MIITSNIVNNIINTTYESLPKKVVLSTERHILDILGVMLPPTTLEKTCSALAEIAKEAGGEAESTLIGFGGKVPSWMAAFVNGSLTHPMDYDDMADEFSSHPSGHTFPAAFAVAEKVGNVSGKEFITAVALAIDLNVRLSASVKGLPMVDFPWFAPCIFGVFSATVVAGKLLGLNSQEMTNALGIILERASGVRESMISPYSEIRGIRDAFGNREGVLAVIMAKKGVAACRDPIEKLYQAFYNNSFDPQLLTYDLGREFWGIKVGFKAWPCCRVTHCYIKACLDMIARYNIECDRIQEIVLTIGNMAKDAVFPLEEKQHPRFPINARISLPFIVGIAFAKRRVIIEDFFEENLNEPNVLQIAEKVKIKFDEKLSEGALTPGVVEVKMQDGTSLTAFEKFPYGHPNNPISDEELIAKFRDCAIYAANRLSEDKLNRLIERILTLDDMESVGDIANLLT
jgi:2-methylcitrate dehydratase PrpD